MARKKYYHPIVYKEFHKSTHGKCVECGHTCSDCAGDFDDCVIVQDRPLTLVLKRDGRRTVMSVKFPAKLIFMCKWCYREALERRRESMERRGLDVNNFGVIPLKRT